MERSREQLLLTKECHLFTWLLRIYLGCADFAWIARPVYCSSAPQLWRGSVSSCCAHLSPGTAAGAPVSPALGQRAGSPNCCRARGIGVVWGSTEPGLGAFKQLTKERIPWQCQQRTWSMGQSSWGRSCSCDRCVTDVWHTQLCDMVPAQPGTPEQKLQLSVGRRSVGAQPDCKMSCESPGEEAEQSRMSTGAKQGCRSHHL